MTQNNILGRLRFFSDTAVIPEDGTSIVKPRFEFTLDPMTGENWIVEVEILGELPWFRGEERTVKVRVLSKEFERQLVKTSNPVYVLRGPKHVGMFELEKSGEVQGKGSESV